MKPVRAFSWRNCLAGGLWDGPQRGPAGKVRTSPSLAIPAGVLAEI